MRNKFNERLKIPSIAKLLSSLGNQYDRSLSLGMFREDVRLGIMPIGGESDRASNFAVEIQGNPIHRNCAIAILEGPPNIYGVTIGGIA